MVGRPKLMPMRVPTGWPLSSVAVAKRLPVRPLASENRGSAPALHKSSVDEDTVIRPPMLKTLPVERPVPEPLLKLSFCASTTKVAADAGTATANDSAPATRYLNITLTPRLVRIGNDLEIAARLRVAAR